jgi:hypothetical protein
VKGEAIEGTIEDPSATITDVSNAPSGTSTPPTSVSETEAPAPAKKTSDKKLKRKREAEDGAVSKKSKKSKKAKADAEAETETVEAKGANDEQAAVAKKLAKLKPAVKADYETRAAAKNQTLEEYVLRRIQKKAKKHTENEDVEAATEPVQTASETPMFFTDLGGDPELANAAPALNRAQRRALEKKKKQGKPSEAAEEQPEAAEKPVDGLKEQSDFISTQQPKEPVSFQVSPDAPVFTYTPLPDGSCPLDPALWKGHKTKHLPRPLRDARHVFQVERRLEKRLRTAKGTS